MSTLRVRPLTYYLLGFLLITIIFALGCRGLVKLDQAIALLTVPGWVFAIGLATQGIKANTRTDWEQQALKDIIPAMTSLADALGGVAVHAHSIVVEPPPGSQKSYWNSEASQVNLEYVKAIQRATAAHAALRLAIEANEIAVIHLETKYHYLYLDLNDLDELFWAKHSEFTAAAFKPHYLTQAEYKDALAVFKSLPEKVSDVTALLYDFRQILQNDFLGDIFDRTLENRVPADSKRKSLGELATKEVVMRRKREYEERLRKRSNS
jgi:hypothetical protein